MALAQVNGVDLIEARVTMPFVGAWTADLAVDVDNASQAVGKVTIDLGGPLQLQGTAVRGGTAMGLTKLRVVGGAAGLPTMQTPKDYRNIPLRTVLQDALSAAGEVLSGVSDSQVLGYELPRWTRFKQRTVELIAALSTEVGCTWRVLYDGTIWLGTDSWPAVAADYDFLHGDPHLGAVEVGMEAHALVPGVGFMGQHVDHVTHTLHGTQIRSRVSFA